MTTKLKLYEDVKDINAAIAGIARRGNKLQADMHRVACSVLQHLGKTKDIRVTLAFIEAMPEMSRVNSLKAWLEAYGPIRFATPEERKEGAPAATFVKDKPTQLGVAMGKPFWKFIQNEGAAYQPVDIKKLVDMTVKRLRKDQTETGVDHSALIASMTSALTAYQPDTAH
ncbi:hypothetical protein [Stappia phage SI01]|uniref:Uncharacterized protein n=1 Tax=Stappia phage SI01 TaxID=2847766 RepID=A0AAE7SUS4_9CAUD|nr:hypothetical protein [Stappia phage SI01]